VKNSEKQLYALYNLAYLDRERGEFATAEEMYAVASALAQRIGQNEVEVGALAGAGLAALEQEKLEEARAAYRAVMEKLNGRADWFQGRELVEALRIRLAARDGDGDAAVRQFLQAHELADSTDAYSAAWLTVVCADSLLSHDRGRIRGVVSDYAGRVRELGYSAMTERYEALLARA
jgi:hypothetical protein